jgi:hypothetical protein
MEHDPPAIADFDMPQSAWVAEAATADVIFTPCGQAPAGQSFDAVQVPLAPVETYDAVEASLDEVLSLFGHETATTAEAPTTTRAKARDWSWFVRTLHLRQETECLARPGGRDQHRA